MSEINILLTIAAIFVVMNRSKLSHVPVHRASPRMTFADLASHDVDNYRNFYTFIMYHTYIFINRIIYEPPHAVQLYLMAG